MCPTFSSGRAKLAAKDVEFLIQGRRLAGKRWGHEGQPPVLALHGWLDNANSFDLIAPGLEGYDLFAMDFAGHGRSDHRPEHTPYLAALDVQDVIAVANALGWERFSLLAHSMGAEVSTHIIGLFPDRVERLFAIEGFAETISQDKWQHLHRDSVDQNLTRQARPLRTFASREDMAQSVVKATGQTLDSARVLIERGTRAVDGGYCWISDPRVRWSDALGITRDRMDHIIGLFDREVLVVGAHGGLKWFRGDLERLSAEFDNFEFTTMEGTHHMHMDADISALTEAISAFLAR